MSEDIKYVEFRGKTIPVKKGKDGFWHDSEGTLYAYTDPKYSVDGDNRCGVGFFSLPNSFVKLNEACGEFHDTAYSDPAYEAFHPRAEADAQLEIEIEEEAGTGALSKIEYGLVGKAFRLIARIFGGPFWENPKTR